MCQRRSLRFESRGKGVVSLPANSYTVSFAKGPIEKVGRPELVQAPACPNPPSTPALAAEAIRTHSLSRCSFRYHANRRRNSSRWCSRDLRQRDDREDREPDQTRSCTI